MKFTKGQRVEAYYSDGWYSGVINTINSDNTYAVAFDDGDYLEDATIDEVRLPVVNSALKSDASSLLDFIQANNIAAPAPSEGIEGINKPSGTGAPSVESILQNVEEFLLPGKISPPNPLEVWDAPNPRDKLNKLLIDIAIYDHIRTMQTMYRDSDDELNLGSDVRNIISTYNPSKPAIMSTDDIMEKITGDRARALALCRLCYGDNSLELIRAELDITASYALRGRWSHVDEKIKRIEGLTAHLTSHHNFQFKNEMDCKQSIRIAKRVACVFDTLRDHVKEYCGQVTPQFLNSLKKALYNLENTADQSSPASFSSFNTQVNDLVSSIDNFIASYKNRGIAIMRYKEQAMINSEEQAKRNMQHIFGANMSNLDSKRGSTLSSEDNEEFPVVSASWGQMLTFLVNDCNIMKTWILEMQNTLLPQNRAVLQFVFKASDAQGRGVCHPQQLSNGFTQYPSVVKVLSGTSVVKTLTQLKLDVPMFVDPKNGKVCDIAAIESNKYRLQDTQRVVYEVPICWEELLALYIIDTLPHGAIDVTRVQTLILKGMAEIFQKQLVAAEEHMIAALNLLEGLGFEMEAIACELYNSIAQMMIMKHREWHSGKKARCKEQAELWVQSAEGLGELDEEVKIVLEHYKKRNIPMSSEEAQQKSRMVLIKARTALLMEVEEDITIQSVTAAFRYLVRSLDIMEKVHRSATHPAIATACLAVASVQNLCGEFEDAREWLMRSLRVMEKLDPVPIRAVAFVHVQLSHVLLKLDHEEESMRILGEASNFFLNKSREGLLKHVSRLTKCGGPNTDSMNYCFYPLHEPVTKYGPSATCYSDIHSTLEHTKKLISINSTVSDNGKFMAVDKSAVLVELVESAFGWDSREAAKQRKEAGDRCVAIEDFGRAHENYVKYYEVCSLLYGENDRRSNEARGLVQKSLAKKMVAAKQQLESHPEEEAAAYSPVEGDVNRGAFNHYADHKEDSESRSICSNGSSKLMSSRKIKSKSQR